MSEFRRYWNFLQKPQRDQISELRKWSDSFSLGPALSQTKPSPAVSVHHSASSVTDVCDDTKTAVVENYFGDESKEGDDDVFASSEDVQLVVERKDDDEVFASSEDDQQLATQIAEKEEKLLEIWEHGPAQLTVSQDMRIAYLEEKLVEASEDIKYLEALLEVRDTDFARYQDLERKQRRHASLLEDEVDNMHAELVEKDKSLRLALRKLDMVRKADTVSMKLSQAQMQLVRSTLALVAKQKKTKLASPHSVQYTEFRPRPLVQDEIAMAEKREWERRKEEQKKEINIMVNHVDRIAASFDRYQNVSTIITGSEPRSEIVPDHLFSWVVKDMIAMWLFSVEPTVEEQEKYEKHLEEQTRPDPIRSPDLPKARINWHRLNPNMKRNLPDPVKFALHGCAQNPEFYTTLAPARYYLGQKTDPSLVFETGKPFGSLYGFWTSKGVLAPPDEPVHGFHCCGETGTWVIAEEGG